MQSLQPIIDLSAKMTLTDLLDDVLNEIFSRLEPSTQIIFISACKKFHQKYFYDFLKNNRKSLTSWLKHRVNENSLSTIPMKLEYHDYDPAELTTLRILFDFLSSKDYSENLFQKILLLLFFNETFIEVLRCLTPYLFYPNERLIIRKDWLSIAGLTNHITGLENYFLSIASGYDQHFLRKSMAITPWIRSSDPGKDKTASMLDKLYTFGISVTRKPLTLSSEFMPAIDSWVNNFVTKIPKEQTMIRFSIRFLKLLIPYLNRNQAVKIIVWIKSIIINNESIYDVYTIAATLKFLFIRQGWSTAGVDFDNWLADTEASSLELGVKLSLSPLQPHAIKKVTYMTNILKALENLYTLDMDFADESDIENVFKICEFFAVSPKRKLDLYHLIYSPQGSHKLSEEIKELVKNLNKMEIPNTVFAQFHNKLKLMSESADANIKFAACDYLIEFKITDNTNINKDNYLSELIHFLKSPKENDIVLAYRYLALLTQRSDFDTTQMNMLISTIKLLTFNQNPDNMAYQYHMSGLVSIISDCFDLVSAINIDSLLPEIMRFTAKYHSPIIQSKLVNILSKANLARIQYLLDNGYTFSYVKKIIDIMEERIKLPKKISFSLQIDFSLALTLVMGLRCLDSKQVTLCLKDILELDIRMSKFDRIFTIFDSLWKDLIIIEKDNLLEPTPTILNTMFEKIEKNHHENPRYILRSAALNILEYILEKIPNLEDKIIILELAGKQSIFKQHISKNVFDNMGRSGAIIAISEIIDRVKASSASNMGSHR